MPNTRNERLPIPGLLLVFVIGACSGINDMPSNPTETVRAMLEASAEAWNAGNLEGFIDDYAASPMTSFMDGTRPQYGIDWIRSNYGPLFADGAERDSLRFEEFAARSLGADYILATARYVLHRADSTTSSGPFTLVLERQDGKWKIIHDHTNADQS